MVLFIGFETRGYRLTVYSRSGEPSLLFDQYYPLDIDMHSIFTNKMKLPTRFVRILLSWRRS